MCGEGRAGVQSCAGAQERIRVRAGELCVPIAGTEYVRRHAGGGENRAQPQERAEASAIRGKTTPRRTREPARVWLRWVAGALSGGARKGGSTRLGAPGGRGRDSARGTETERKRETGREREQERAREKKGGKEGQIDRRIERERSQERRRSEHVSRG